VKRVLFILTIITITLFLASCDSDGKDSLASTLNSTSGNDSSVSVTSTDTTTTSGSSNTTVANPSLEGLITDNSGNAVSGILISIISSSNSSLKYQSQTKAVATDSKGNKYNFKVGSIVSGDYVVTMNKPGYLEKEFLLTVSKDDIYINTEMYYNLSDKLGVINAHYAGTTPAVSDISEITLYKYLTQDSVTINTSPALAKIDPSKSGLSTDGYFKFDDLPETITYIKKIYHSDGSVEELQMATHYQIIITFKDGSTIISNDILITAGETTLVEINESSASTVTIPSLISPEDSSEVSSEAPLFSWTPVNGAVKYEIIVKEDMSYTNGDHSAFGDISADDRIVWQSIVSSTSVVYSQIGEDINIALANSSLGIYTGDTPVLENGKRYYWQVRAIDEVNALGFNSFQAGAPHPHCFLKRNEAAPAIVSPSNGATITDMTPTFAWNLVPDSKQYVLEVYSDAAATNIIWQHIENITEFEPSKYSVTNVEYSGPTLVYGNTYYWRVSATDNNNTPTNWSQIASFNIPEAPPTPINLAAISNGPNTAAITLSWDLPSGTTVAQLQALNMAGFYIYRSTKDNAATKPTWVAYWDGSTLAGFTMKDAPLITGEVYAYQVASFTTDGIEGAKSNLASDMAQ